jgi:hypothetical protein
LLAGIAETVPIWIVDRAEAQGLEPLHFPGIVQAIMVAVGQGHTRHD